MHWIRLILAGDGDRTPFVVIFRLLGYSANGLWFLCDHSRWWTAIRGLSPARDPLVPLNRVCAVVQQGSLVMLNLRNIVIVLSEVWRTLYDAEANRRARGLLLALLPHVVKNFADLVGQWNFGLQLGLSDFVLNWTAIAASMAGLYVEVSRAKLREQTAQKNIRRANPHMMALKKSGLRVAAGATTTSASEDEPLVPRAQFSESSPHEAALDPRGFKRRNGAARKRSPLVASPTRVATARAAPRRSPKKENAGEVGDGAAEGDGEEEEEDGEWDELVERLRGPREESTSVEGADSAAARRKSSRRSSMVMSPKQMRRIAGNALDHRGGAMFAQIPDVFEGIRLVRVEGSPVAPPDPTLFGY
jgi:hypothetical protein